MDFANKVKHVRASLLINQKELAKLIGVTNITICRWENQIVKPSFLDEKKLEALAKEKGIIFEE